MRSNPSRTVRRQDTAVLTTAVFVLVAAACETDRLDVRLEIPRAYRDEVVQTSLAVLRPAEDAFFDCDDVAMGSVDEEVLRASQLQEVRTAAGGRAKLAGIDRVGRKLLYARGFSLEQQAVVAACEEVGLIDGKTVVELTAEPVKTLVVETSGSAGNGAQLTVTVRDALGRGLTDIEVLWSSVGADGLEVVGSVVSGAEGDAELDYPTPSCVGPMVLELMSRWQVAPVELKGFRPPSAPRQQFDVKLFWPGNAKYGVSRETWSNVRLGRLGPQGEVGLAALVDFHTTLDGTTCALDQGKCVLACADDTDKEACEQVCRAEYVACVTPYLEVRRPRPDGEPELVTRRLPFGAWHAETLSSDYRLLLSRAPKRDRLFIVPLHQGGHAWYELDASGSALLSHEYELLPGDEVFPVDALALPKCEGAAEEARMLVVFSDGASVLYALEGGAPLAGHPLAGLADLVAQTNASTLEAGGLSAACVGEVVGQDEHLVVRGASASGGHWLAAVVGESLILQPWSPIAAFGHASRRSESETAALLIGQMGTGTAEVARVRLRLSEPLSDSTLEVVSGDPLLALPTSIAAGEIDGRDVPGSDVDVIALVSLLDSVALTTDHYVQVISGHRVRDNRLAGLFRVVSADNSGLVPHLAFDDANGDGIDDLVVLNRVEDESNPGLGARLTIYSMGK